MGIGFYLAPLLVTLKKILAAPPRIDNYHLNSSVTKRKMLMLAMLCDMTVVFKAVVVMISIGIIHYASGSNSHYFMTINRHGRDSPNGR